MLTISEKCRFHHLSWVYVASINHMVEFIKEKGQKINSNSGNRTNKKKMKTIALQFVERLSLNYGIFNGYSPKCFFEYELLFVREKYNL